MRILFVSQLLPFPLDAGPKIRAHYVLRQLARAGHEVTLLCWVRPTDRADDVQAVARLCHGVVTSVLRRSRLTDLRDGVLSTVTGEPFLVRRDRTRDMDESLRRLTGGRSFDAVHADQLWMAGSVAEHADVGFKVLDQHNAVFKVPARMADCSSNPVSRVLLRAEARKLEAYERHIIGCFSRVVWVSREDRDALADAGAGIGEHQPVIPIAIDPSITKPVQGRRPFRVTFVGGLHWPPNREAVGWFARRVWPRVARAVPGAVLTIIGKGSSGLKATEGPRIEVTGYVADATPYLEDTAAFVVPLLSGAGVRVKILDAWCRGLPIVSTSVGAEGLDARDAENILLADDPDVFAEKVVRVLRSNSLAHRLGTAGRLTVESTYDWRETYRAWDQVYA